MSAAQTIQSLKTLARQGRPVALSPGTLDEIAEYLEDATAQYDEAKAVAKAQDAAVTATLRARAYRAEGRKIRAEARQMRRVAAVLLVAQFLCFVVASALVRVLA